MESRAGTDLGRAIALVLRGGTILAVAGIGAGFLLAIFNDAEVGPAPLVTMLRAGGADALIGAGLLAMTLTPAAALVAAAVVLARTGERRRAIIACLVLLLLLVGLAAAALLQGPS
ncbi:MAG TPA: DUF1634 domain-containing protein [Candidatus Limnocylindria bacterium]|jgi:hypothetical protein